MELGRYVGAVAGSTQNAFFRDLYANLARMLSAPMHPLFGFEAREHTAQVDPDNREIREKRFRFGKREREELARRRAATARGRRGQSVPAGPVLLTHLPWTMSSIPARWPATR